jgi:DNA-binding transcriptional regulator GbsR (MarR family)
MQRNQTQVPTLAPVSTQISDQHQKAAQGFVLLWGEMASSWGINRTMAQIYALLYISDSSLDTDEIMSQLGISRGNANMNLRALISWDLIRKVHQMGSRKDYYTAEKDVWKMSAIIIQERHRREIKPIRQKLEENLSELQSVLDDLPAESPIYQSEMAFMERIQNFSTLLLLFEGFIESIVPMIQERGIEDVKVLASFVNMLKTKNE